MPTMKLSTQCAAVSTQVAATSEPPQNWLRSAPPLTSATCHGVSAMSATGRPPTISGLTGGAGSSCARTSAGCASMRAVSESVSLENRMVQSSLLAR